ncbi:MAG: hypothetical protein Q9159_001081 [Coniocarpon cinnabarinum]
MADPDTTQDDPVASAIANDGEDVEMTGGMPEDTEDPLPGDVMDEPAKRISFLERTIPLPDDDIEAVGSVLEYIYNGEYFPRRTGDGRADGLESDPSTPAVDQDGSQLLKHARVYTLAEKFQMPQLKSLAHIKINRTTSTARGEIAYARYVYSSTSPEDKVIRNPVAAFWATRSHVLRHDAEEEFRAMCLEFPQFGFDVLQRVLDQKEKQRGGNLGISDEGAVGVAVGGTPSGTGRGKKRARLSGA